MASRDHRRRRRGATARGGGRRPPPADDELCPGPAANNCLRWQIAIRCRVDQTECRQENSRPGDTSSIWAARSPPSGRPLSFFSAGMRGDYAALGGP